MIPNELELVTSYANDEGMVTALDIHHGKTPAEVSRKPSMFISR